MNIMLHGSWRYSTEDTLNFASPEFNDADWATMSIPRNWFLGGLDHHGVVWFRHSFDYDRMIERPHVTLHFDGVDYFCDVYVNGSYLGHHQGYFEPFSFDVTNILLPGKNVIAVRVDSPHETPGSDGWPLHKKLIKGIFNHHNCRPGGGWEAEGQSYNTGGIWNRVYLEEHGALTIERILLHADLEHEPPLLHMKVSVRNHAPSQHGQLRVICDAENFRGRGFATLDNITIPAGESAHHITMEVPEVALWQPWDRGLPHLYRLSVRLDGDTNEASQNIQGFGFRTIRVDKKLNWYINGERLFIRGSNYIASQWLAEAMFAEVSADENHPFGGGPGRNLFAADVERMKKANLNLIRVHGHVLPPEFHEACDRAGIMVWQDFALQWGYTDELYFHDEAERQIEAMVMMLFNHPSIVAWCCHNESPWDTHWMVDRLGSKFDSKHNRALDMRLEKTVKTLDPTRYIHRNSGTGDAHVYRGWYEGTWRDYKDLPGAPLLGEYGAQSLPVRAALRRTFRGLGADAGHAELVKFRAFLDKSRKYKDYRRVPPADEIPEKLQRAREAWIKWCFHNFQPAETFRRAEIDMGKTLDEFIANSQVYQSHLIQYATEYFRRAKYIETSGIIQIDFTDPWPAVSWSVLDYWRTPKSAYDALRRSMQPVLPTFRLPDDIKSGKSVRLDFWVVNDHKKEYADAVCTWKLERNKKKVAVGELAIDVPSDGISVAKHVNLPVLKRGEYKLSVTVSDSGLKLLGENVYELHIN
jgi:beta-mannosidase